MTDLQIAQSVKEEHIRDIAAKLNIKEESLEFYGTNKAKLPLTLIDEKKVDQSNLVLVTAITPTPAGEGKTTVSIGLGDAMNINGENALTVIREPSLGPVFGIKGGAAGGGWSQVIPMVDINLHFTGDFHAIEKANNLLSALIENNIQTKKRNLGIDPRTVLWKRCMDMNDRGLRNIVAALGGKAGGMPRETGFNITAASEIMAILCLSKDFEDLKEKCGNIYVGDTWEGKPVYARDLNAHGAMAALMRDAIKPNLVQTLEGNPSIIHGGPFANIAQGTNSILATKMGLSLSDYVITEAGFGADLGAEKFMNIKCREAGLSPKTIVLVATIRALKYHGGKPLNELTNEDTEALKAGFPNLERHISSLQSFGVPVVVAINTFSSDTDAEKQALMDHCDTLEVPVALSNGWAEGGKGCTDLAKKVVEAVKTCKGVFTPTYSLEDSPRRKMEKICSTIYGAENVILTNKANRQLKRFEELGYGKLPVCMAKTQKSLSDDEKQLGRPRFFDIHIREIEIATGAGFMIPIAGNILRMPGLPATPAAENIDIDGDGNITGLF
ncbi:MAG: formate--tetrahydrofolate ligase [Bacteroidia bacterium]|nr:formate--tetrahydrofolate ligase [Bacteroidia bacterium]NNF31012.1 formate--tetrahydrofolate ligase [Flavobacteriaceae bacterium]MBT8276862.1 formate--tetrahydrofolate ligase [Bacteroidia bacterium]NNJ82432.1 formate--tetrahydrofolate ligase [Flavobacteriaceae bacterium]NNK53080.1 formate--tetrahydrofolate ligase [Flavobacteriaceae bacterium]